MILLFQSVLNKTINVIAQPMSPGLAAIAGDLNEAPRITGCPREISPLLMLHTRSQRKVRFGGYSSGFCEWICQVYILADG